MVTLRWHWCSMRRGNTYMGTYRHYRSKYAHCAVSNFLANVYWLTQSNGLKLVTADELLCYRKCLTSRMSCCNVKTTCWAFTCVEWRAPLCACFFQSIFARKYYQGAVCQCTNPFAIYATVLFCHPTLPIITHKKRYSTYPLGQMCTHMQHTNTITKRGVYEHADSVSS